MFRLPMGETVRGFRVLPTPAENSIRLSPVRDTSSISFSGGSSSGDEAGVDNDDNEDAADGDDDAVAEEAADAGETENSGDNLSDAAHEADPDRKDDVVVLDDDDSVDPAAAHGI